MHATPKSASVTTVAVDLAKDVFELAFADANARILERRRLTRTAFARAFANRPPLRIVMEACGSAHDWARRFARLGHAIELPLRTRCWRLTFCLCLSRLASNDPLQGLFIARK